MVKKITLPRIVAFVREDGINVPEDAADHLKAALKPCGADSGAPQPGESAGQPCHSKPSAVGPPLMPIPFLEPAEAPKTKTGAKK